MLVSAVRYNMDEYDSSAISPPTTGPVAKPTLVAIRRMPNASSR